ncbi:MAG TPA: hypothetical protein VN040_00985, partial [Pseudosphingobacterium sp.]|nr:hypothetical protein [Pseudosphingobacterium sp.]
IYIKISMKSQKRFQDWDKSSMLFSLIRIMLSLLRGTYYRLFFKRSKGWMLLVGKNTVIRQSRYLSVGNEFIADDYCEINCLSKRGIVIGDRVSIGRYAF